MSVYLCGGTTKITMRKRLTEEIRAERSAASTNTIPVVALLENLRSAHNVGSFFRTADAFGLASVWLSGYTRISKKFFKVRGSGGRPPKARLRRTRSR